jgi:NAD(P)H dehydrogenase (quinone)
MQNKTAAILSDIKGKTIAYYQPEVCSYVSRLVDAGFPKDDAAYLARFVGAIAKGDFDTKKSDVKQLVGRSPISLKNFLRNIYSK